MWVLVVAVILASIAGLVFWQKEDVRFYSVHTDKLGASAKAGDLIIAKHVNTSNSPILFSDIKDKVVVTIPSAGYIFDFMRRPVALIAIVYLPALLILAAHLKKVIRKGYQPYKIARYL